MPKMPWAKGRKEPSKWVRLDERIHAMAKEEAYEKQMSLKEWISLLIEDELMKKGK